jgi:hypothetical protein
MAEINWIKANLRGRLGQIVGSSWKGIPYVKTFTPPGNPKTPNQVAVRNVFANTVHIAKSINRNILRPFTFPKPKKMSAYNRMIQINQPMFSDLEWSPAKLKIFDGPMFTPAIEHVYLVNDGSRVIGVELEIKPYEGELEDILIGVIFDETTNVVLSAWSDMAKEWGGLIEGVTIDTGAYSLTLENLHAYVALVRPPSENIDEPGMVSKTAYLKTDASTIKTKQKNLPSAEAVADQPKESNTSEE